VIDAPLLPGEEGATPGPLVAVFADPWPGRVELAVGANAAGLSPRGEMTRPATLGWLRAGLAAGPVGRWDWANTLEVELVDGGLASLTAQAVRAGGNGLLIEGLHGWECVQFTHAELVGADSLGTSRWRLTGLLRGQQGTEAVAVGTGARVMVLDGAAVRVSLSVAELGVPLLFRATTAPGATADVMATVAGRTRLPWRPAGLRLGRDASGARVLHWRRRTRIDGDGWGPGDVGLAEEIERYEVRALSASGAVVRRAETSAPVWAWATRAADLADGAVALEVSQLSLSHGPGAATRLNIV